MSKHVRRWRNWLSTAAAAAVLAGIALALWQGTLLNHQGNAEAAPDIAISVGDRWFCDAGFQGGVCDRKLVAGDAVIWTWVGGLPHSVTECGENRSKGLTCSGDGGPDWSSDTQSAGSFFRPFDTPGTYYYRCTVHPTFKRGTITVNPPAVGGVAELPEVAGISQSMPESSGANMVVVGSVVAGSLVAVVVLGGAAWFVRRRRAT